MLNCPVQTNSGLTDVVLAASQVRLCKGHKQKTYTRPNTNQCQ